MEKGIGGINGDERKLDFGPWIYNTIYKWCIIDLYTWNLYNFINQCCLSKFNKNIKERKEKKRKERKKRQEKARKEKKKEKERKEKEKEKQER